MPRKSFDVEDGPHETPQQLAPRTVYTPKVKESPFIPNTMDIGVPGKARTVSDLIVALQMLRPGALIVLEGCDCTGSWSGLIDYTDTHVLLRR
jgi:hypothetical protein